MDKKIFMNIRNLILTQLGFRLWLLPIILILFDQFIKYIMFLLLFKPMIRIELVSFLNLIPVWNNGISFGMFNDSGNFGRYFFCGLGLTFGFIIPIISRDWSKFERIGASLLAGGAIGNAVDRIFYGRVVDFLDFHWHDLHFPAFNLADSFITIGVFIIIMSNLGKKNTDD